MKFNLALLVTFVFFCNLKAQEKNVSFSIEYKYSLNQSEFTQFYQARSLLTFNKTSSLYEIDHTNSFKESFSKQNGEGQLTYSLKAKENEYVYKDFIQNEIYYSNLISMQKFNIKDSLSQLKWTLNNKHKEILGYTCQEATALFGGRFYIAYFTTDIPVPNGPWRFHGLPGVILEIYSIDKIFKIEATAIQVKNEKLEIVNPFEEGKLISWNKFLSLYKKKYDEVRRNSMTEWGPSQTLPKKGIVEYIKD